MLYPVLWAGLLLLFRKKGDQKETDIELRRIGLLWLGLTVFMAVLTAAAGGLMDRYRMDYAIFASLAYAAAMIGLMGKRVTCRTNMEKTESKWGKMEWLSLLWGIFTIATIITSVLLYFEEGVWWIAEANPEWYSRLAHGIEFWR